MKEGIVSHLVVGETDPHNNRQFQILKGNLFSEFLDQSGGDEAFGGEGHVPNISG